MLMYKMQFEHFLIISMGVFCCHGNQKKGKRKIQGVPQSQIAAPPRHQEETDKTEQAQIEQTHEKHQDADQHNFSYFNPPPPPPTIQATFLPN